jgi:hypothetical protein
MKRNIVDWFSYQQNGVRKPFASVSTKEIKAAHSSKDAGEVDSATWGRITKKNQRTP